ncbi:TonB-dependent receptor [Flavivirga sp. 57AJ16]|uniref:SusC/RagA family TonB-linked outer membrane protein n=1 Tax=Flavivirga sp. 57AJ16 TaxID=3025307 RepID=UPI002366EA1C|nr:TonB-dependent receptor [Flavivirga sp. 57AJ16]MDD7885084.1 TonB-dependent receptor [Flavivirga sp. 57AJ16]
MRSFILLFCTTAFSLNPGNLSSQNDKIAIDKDIVLTVDEVFDLIMDQSDYTFIYKVDMFKNFPKIHLKKGTIKISELLVKSFKKDDFNFTFKPNKNIHIKQKIKDIDASLPQQQITGIVTDIDKQPLPGVSVIIKGTTRGVATDFDGNFSISVEKGETLVFSMLGFANEEVEVNEQQSLNIVLEENVSYLDDVVVVGYGTQKIKDVTGSVSQISSEVIEDRPILQLTEALAGKAAGVTVVSSSGKPQSGSFLRIRGTTSISASSEPLYVVDGIPVEVIYDINPNDIESISILKDASSAAIYGASGANGVVIINTKRGAKGGQISFDTYIGASTITKKLGTLDRSQYIDLMDDLGLSVPDWSIYTANTNWQDEIYRTALRKNYQLSFSGIENGINYYISGNYQNAEGIVRTNSVERYSAKFNLSTQIRKWLKVGTNLTYSKWRDVDVTDNVGAGRGGVVLGALVTPSLISIFNEDGTYTGNPLQASWENPVASTDAPDKEYLNSRFLGTFYFDADITNEIQYTSRFSIDDTQGSFSNFLDPFTTDFGRATQGTAYESSNKSFYWILENMLTYEKTIGDHEFKVLGGFISSKRKNTSLSGESNGFGSGTVTSVGGGTTNIITSSNVNERSNQSFISRLNYDYKDKYLLTANFRADASSVFGPSNQWGYFPSFSIGWRLSKENFINENGFFNDIKIRFGWGEVGNDRIEPYAWYGQVGTGYNYVIGGNIIPGIAAETLENKDLKWEISTQTDLGLDIAFLDNRLNVIMDYYIKDTKDLLIPAPLPTSSGFLNSTQNVGGIKNKGLEVSILGKIINTELFTWDTNFNISFNKNEITDLKGQIFNDGDIFQRGNVVRAEKGQPIGNFWGFISDGVDIATGDIIYRDLDESGDITAEGDKTIIGNANPDFTYGFTNTLKYKGFGLSVFLQGVQGNDIFNATRVETEAMTDFKSQSSSVLNRWRQPGDVTDIPRAVLGDKTNSDLSSRFIEDGSYLKIRTLTCSYDLSKKFLEKTFLTKLKLYVTGENLATFTNYSGYDPEVNAFGSSNLVQGVDYGTYPQIKNFILGLNASF